MSESAIRAAIYAAVGGVSNVGKVYDYERWAATWPDFLALFKTTVSGTDQIRGWEVSYRGFSAERDSQFRQFKRHTHTFWVQGYMGVSDADETEKTFATLAHAVVSAIDSDSTLHSTVYKFTGPVSMPICQTRMFSDVFCHYAQIVVTVQEQVS